MARVAGAYYQNYPSAAEADQPDYGLQAGTNDRTLDVFTFPMVLTAFFSAMMGGLMAPMIVGVTRRWGNTVIARTYQVLNL